MEAIITMLTAAVSGIITLIGNVADALLTTDGAWAPLLAFLFVGVGVSAVLLGVKVVRGLIWGA